jgi:IclR family acetate operon transcriptional repressor
VKSVESVLKASKVLKTFEPARRLLTVREIAARTGIARSTAHTICVTLAAEGLLEARPGGGYRLGPELAEMGGQVIERTGLVEAALPAMQQLSRSERGEIHLGQLVSGWIVYLNRIEGEQRFQMRNRMGLRAPAYLTGCGLAALSALSPEHASELLRTYQSDADFDSDAVMRDLEVSRERGYTVSSTFQPEVMSVAAPLFGPENAVVGGLSVAQARNLMDARRVSRVGEAVIRAANMTSERLLSFVWRFG